MPKASQFGSTDATSNAQGRFTVALPAELRPELEKASKKMSDAIKEQSGVAFDLSIGQVCQALIKSGLADLAKSEA